MRFKTGDKVVCTVPTDTVQADIVYEVSSAFELRGENYISLKEIPDFSGFLEFRFALADNTTNSGYCPYKLADQGLTERPDLREDLSLNLAAINTECEKAMINWPPFNSAHEGFAVLKEEVDELWDHVKMKPSNRNVRAMKYEAIQVAAMALRFATEICDV